MLKVLRKKNKHTRIDDKKPHAATEFDDFFGLMRTSQYVVNLSMMLSSTHPNPPVSSSSFCK